MSRPTCALARVIPPTPASEDDLRSMRAAAWHKQGVLAVSLESLTDSWERTLLEAIGSRLYGRRQPPLTGGPQHGR